MEDAINISLFFGGLTLFFAAHFFTTFRPRGERDIRERMGRGPYMGLYSLVSLAGFVAMVWGFAGIKPWIPLWHPPAWSRHVTMALMLPAFVLLVAAYTPTGFIKKAVGHPMLLAVLLWSLGHLIANGDLAGIALFGAFFVYSLVDRFAVRARGDRGPKPASPSILGDMIAVAIGLAVYGLFIYDLHDRLIGIPLIVVDS